MSTAASKLVATNRRPTSVHEQLAPRPTSIEETGLTDAFIAELIVKHLYEGGVLSMPDLAGRIK
ncbi:MAG: hypothetical protein OES99_06120, partial [Gammaproteobacteria bacterium]|nr:hypothetical protein [Gammaproteobacteria bacterium]